MANCHTHTLPSITTPIHTTLAPRSPCFIIVPIEVSLKPVFPPRQFFGGPKTDCEWRVELTGVLCVCAALAVGLSFAGYDLDKDEEPAEDDEWETEADFVVRTAPSYHSFLLCRCPC